MSDPYFSKPDICQCNLIKFRLTYVGFDRLRVNIETLAENNHSVFKEISTYNIFF